MTGEDFNHFKTQGIVIKKTNSFNNDVYLTMYTDRFGKLDVISKNGKSLKGLNSSASKLFICADFVISRSRKGNLYLRSSDIVFSHYKLFDQYENLMLGTYFLEIVGLSTKVGDPDSHIYYLLRSVLHILSEDLLERRLLRAYFNVNLGVLLGVANTGFNEDSSDVMKYCSYLSSIEPARLSKAKIDTHTLKLMEESAELFESHIRRNFDLPPLKSKGFLE